MKPEDIIEGSAGESYFVLGNEAIVRGALEGGLALAATYPGTPASEIGSVLFEIAEKAGIYFEFSINEKVAMEVAASAASCGVRSMVFMKHVGLNVAADPFITTLYTGTEGGFIVVVADDPSMHSSQNEQDTRYYAELSRAPMLEPSNPKEAYLMLKEGFSLSEKVGLPILVRTTTRVAHIRQVVKFGDLRAPRLSGIFEKNPSRWVPVPAFACRMHKELLEKMENVKSLAEESNFNSWITIGSEPPQIGIITSGCAFNYVMDVVKAHDLSVSILKLGMTNPIPSGLISRFLKSCSSALIVEELDPHLEREARNIAQMCELPVEIKGKMDGHFSRLYEYNEDIVKEATFKALRIKSESKVANVPKMELPARPPILCPGCSHRATYYAARVALQKSKIKDAIFPSDIGCYTLGIQPPSSMADYLLCMGSSMGSASGISKVTGKKVIAFIGDSTFFHSGVAGLINAYHNLHDFIVVILDNRTTAMTGHQPHPGLSYKVKDKIVPQVSMEKLVKGIGIEHVEVVDPYNVDETVKVFSEALGRENISVIISRRECVLIASKSPQKGAVEGYVVNQDTCVQCKICVRQFACPAFFMTEDRVYINSALCSGCGVCPQICPSKAIEESHHE